jgi:peptide deformylase
MAILKIARMGNPILHRPADPVSDPMAPDIRRLIMDMIETMKDAPGVGLAAPQVHVPKRVVILEIADDRADGGEDGEDEEDGEDGEDGEHGVAGDGEDADDGPLPLTVLINPELDDEVAMGWEGCLSVPGMTGLVPRFINIRYRALAPDGSAIERTASGFHARVVQHECDHLDGILYPMRMPDLSLFGFAEEMKRRLQSLDEEPI